MSELPANYTNPLRVTLVIGQGSTGKTTFGIRYLLNVPWACAFIFDQNGQISDRMRVPHVGTALECENALANRVVCFNPYRMWPDGELDAAFNWFTDWAFAKSKTGPGRKILFCDDAWEFSAARNLTPELARVVRTGRFWELEYFGLTHRPQDYHITVRSLVTEWVAFNTVQTTDLQAVEDYWPGVTRAATLEKGEFIAYNRNSRAELLVKKW